MGVYQAYKFYVNIAELLPSPKKKIWSIQLSINLNRDSNIL